MAVLQAPVANATYWVAGTDYTSDQAGQITVTDAGHIALLQAMGLSVLGGAQASAGSTVASGSTTATGPSATLFKPRAGDFSFSIWGTFSGTLQIERSTNGGSTWLPVSSSPGAGAQTWTQPGSAVLSEPENGAAYRVNATAVSSGTINWRFGQG